MSNSSEAIHRSCMLDPFQAVITTAGESHFDDSFHRAYQGTFGSIRTNMEGPILVANLKMLTRLQEDLR